VVMNEVRETECAKCGSGTRTEEWTVPDQPEGAVLVGAWCDNPYCEDYLAPSPDAG
jgi:hypothetical protein